MNNPASHPDHQQPALQVKSDVPFYVGLSVIGGAYVLLLAGMLIAAMTHTSPDDIWASLRSNQVQYSIKLSLLSCAITTILSVWVAVPIGYLMSRYEFRGKSFIDSLLDIPIVLPPLVVGLCLLVFFNSPAVSTLETWLHELEGFLADNLIPAVILLALLTAGCAMYLALTRWIPRRTYRALLIGSAVTAAFFALSGNYVAPRMPAWVPVPQQFTPVDIDYRDQAPFVRSRNISTGTYTYTATADDLAAVIERHYGDAGFSTRRILGRREALYTEGTRRYLFPIPSSVDAPQAQNREILVSVRSRDNVPALRRRGVDMRKDPIEWVVAINVQRQPSEAQESFVPQLTFPVTMEIPAVILAQFMVACAFAVRTMRVTFDQLSPRHEQVALTLGCSRSQAFWLVVLPQCRRGMLAAATLAWARSLGEFGPILIFAGATRLKTEVLSTTVFLELSVGNMEGAVAASLIMIASAIIVLVIARVFGLKRTAF